MDKSVTLNTAKVDLEKGSTESLQQPEFRDGYMKEFMAAYESIAKELKQLLFAPEDKK
ncbi:MAG: hypothetical protein AAF518_10230 [Spirochaetota bacterium]